MINSCNVAVNTQFNALTNNIQHHYKNNFDNGFRPHYFGLAPSLTSFTNKPSFSILLPNGKYINIQLPKIFFAIFWTMLGAVI